MSNKRPKSFCWLWNEALNKLPLTV